MPTPNRDAEHLAKLRDYFAEARRIPSQQRIAELIGFSKAAARKLLERLEAQGFLDRTPDDDAWVPAKRFYVRKLEDDAVWLILPDREVRLARNSDSRYSNGITVLELSGTEASLSDGPAALNGCKAATPS